MKMLTERLNKHKKELEDMEVSLSCNVSRLGDLLGTKYALYNKAKHHARKQKAKINGNIHEFMNEADRGHYLRIMSEIEALKDQKKGLCYKVTTKRARVSRMKEKLERLSK